MPMKISRVESFFYNKGKSKNFLFCRVETDTGIHGWGEAYIVKGTEKSVDECLRTMGQVAIGRSPFNIRHLGQALFDDLATRRGSMPFFSAWSAVELALWDIVGKEAGLPVYNLLGGASREAVRVYANGWSSRTKSIDQNIESLLKVKAQGFTGAKFDPLPDPWRTFIHQQDEDHAVAYVKAAREAVGPDFLLLIEIHRRLSPATAIRLGRRLLEFDIGWFEEPCLGENIELVAEVRRALPCPIVTGEGFYLKEHFLPTLNARAADILNPDICACGGISQMLDIAAMAQPHAVAISPHNYNSTLVGVAATVQFSAMIPNFMIAEYFIYDRDGIDEVAILELTPKDSFIELPTAAGLGVDLDAEQLRKYRYRDSAPKISQYWEEYPRKNYRVNTPE